MTGYDARTGVLSLSEIVTAVRTALLAHIAAPTAESQVTNLVTDLAAKALLGQLVGKCDPANTSLGNAQFLFQYKRLILTGIERLTAAGSADAVIGDFGYRPTEVFLGNPKVVKSSFVVPNDYQLDLTNRLALPCLNRADLRGTADLILTDDFSTRGRIVLSGRG